MMNVLTVEQEAILKGAGLDTNPTTRREALRMVERSQRADAVAAATTALAGMDSRGMSAKAYAAHKRDMARALRGIMPR